MGALCLKLAVLLAGLGLACAAAASGVVFDTAGIPGIHALLGSLPRAGDARTDAPFDRLTLPRAGGRSGRAVLDGEASITPAATGVARLSLAGVLSGAPAVRSSHRPFSGRSPPSA